MPNPALSIRRRSVKERVEALLSEYLETRTAEVAVKIASRTWLRVEPEDLVDSHLLGLTYGLRPILDRLLGAQLAAVVVERVLRIAGPSR